MSRDKGEGFAADVWLENDGAPALQAVAASRAGLEFDGRTIRGRVGDFTVLNVRGKTARAALVGCAGADLVVFDTVVDEDARPCLTLDPVTLSATGSVAGWAEGRALRLVTAREVSGQRRWTPRPRRDAPDAATPPVLLAKVQ